MTTATITRPMNIRAEYGVGAVLGASRWLSQLGFKRRPVTKNCFLVLSDIIAHKFILQLLTTFFFLPNFEIAFADIRLERCFLSLRIILRKIGFPSVRQMITNELIPRPKTGTFFRFRVSAIPQGPGAAFAKERLKFMAKKARGRRSFFSSFRPYWLLILS